MLILFQSKAGADVLMMGAQAHELLQALGREPADRGVFLSEQIATALTALDQALRQAPEQAEQEDIDTEAPPLETALRQRAWPVQDLLQRALALGVDVIWQPA